MKILVALSVALLSAAAASQTRAPDPQERICRTAGETGSRLGKRTRLCLTRAEWTERRRDMRSQIDGAQSRQGNITVDEKTPGQAIFPR